MADNDKKQVTQLQVIKKGMLSGIKKWKHSPYALPVIIAMSCILFLVIVFSIFVCVNKFNVNVYKNVYVLGENVSGYTSSELLEMLTGKNEEMEVSFYQDTENIYLLKSSQIDFGIDVESTVNKVMAYGRGKNVFANTFDILKAKIRKIEINPAYKYNEEKVDETIKNIDLSLKDRFVEDTYSVDVENANLIIVKGKTGNSIDYENVKKQIVDSFKSKQTSIMLNIISKKPEDIDVEKLYNTVKKEPKDAYIDKEADPIKFVKEEVGIDFSLDALKAELEKAENKEEGKTITFALTKIEPKVKLQDITYDMYNDKLAGYTTYFDASNYARGNNLEVALRYLNGVVVMPGEIFSYNDTVGDTTASKGYLPAAVFKAGRVENEVGGGICQTTSTLYNVALMSNLEIVERHPHGLPVGYVPPSRDATVYIGVLDFKFKNTRNYPIKIVTSYSWNGTMNVSIYGTKEENETEVILSSAVTGTIPYTTKYNYDASLGQGESYVVSGGVNGYTSEGYITKKQNGVVISSSLLSRDTYYAQQEIVNVGTGNFGS